VQVFVGVKLFMRNPSHSYGASPVCWK